MFVRSMQHNFCAQGTRCTWGANWLGLGSRVDAESLLSLSANVVYAQVEETAGGADSPGFLGKPEQVDKSMS